MSREALSAALSALRPPKVAAVFAREAAPHHAAAKVRGGAPATEVGRRGSIPDTHQRAARVGRDCYTVSLSVDVEPVECEGRRDREHRSQTDEHRCRSGGQASHQLSLPTDQ